MSNEQKIKLWDLLQHVLEQRHGYDTPHLFGLGQNEFGGSDAYPVWCKLVVENLTDEIRQTISKMQEVALVVLGKNLSVTVYTKSERITPIERDTNTRAGI